MIFSANLSVFVNPSAWLTRTCKFATKITNIKSFHINTFLHHLTILSQFYFVVPSPCQQKQIGQCSVAGGRVGGQDPSKRGQWTLVMPPPGGCVVHLRTMAMAVASREGEQKWRCKKGQVGRCEAEVPQETICEPAAGQEAEAVRQDLT